MIANVQFDDSFCFIVELLKQIDWPPLTSSKMPRAHAVTVTNRSPFSSTEQRQETEKNSKSKARIVKYMYCRGHHH